MAEQTQRHFIKQSIRGGQITLHNVRMMSQVVKWLALSHCLLFFLMVGLSVFAKTSRHERQLFETWTWATVHVFFDTEATQRVSLSSKPPIRINSRSVLASPVIQRAVLRIKHQVIESLRVAGIMTVGLLFLSLASLYAYGLRQSRYQQRRGHPLVTPKALSQLLSKNNQASDLTIANIPMVKDSECSHFFIHGTTGTGKSQLFYQFLDNIREKGQRAIIYDKGCAFTERYYRPGKDVILNPLDRRCPVWELWAECADRADFDSIAEALVPQPSSHGDPFWISAARTLFSNAAYQLSQQKNPLLSELLRLLLSAELKELHQHLQGTPAQMLVSPSIEKTALSIRAVLANALKPLIYLEDSGEPFSIRQWVSEESDDRWLFVTSLPQKHATLKPLISLWLDIASNALMSLPASHTRRIWMLFDELPTLNKIPCLPGALAESRKYGGCILLGMQSIAQLRHVYGHHEAEGLKGLCNTSFFLRAPAGSTADWAAKELGEYEQKEIREGLSYGANTLRDGVSINRQTIKRPVVIGAEISQLPNLTAFVKVLGDYPVTKTEFHYQDRPCVQTGFVAKPLQSTPFQPYIPEACQSDKPVAPTEVTLTQPSCEQDNSNSLTIEQARELDVVG